MKKRFEYHGQNVYNPTGGFCFIKCINYFTHEEYAEEFLDFNRIEKYRSVLMTSARIPPGCKIFDINIGCFDGTRTNPRNMTHRNISLYINKKPFCLILKQLLLVLTKQYKNIKH